MKSAILLGLSTCLIALANSAPASHGSHSHSAHSGPVPKFKGRFSHPGALHSAKDIERVKDHVNNKDEPWYRAFQHLEKTSLAQPTYKIDPKEVIIRNADPKINLTNNYPSAYRAAHSAYQLALRWYITSNETYAIAAIKNLDSWSAKLKDIDGNEDKYLAAGLYGYQFANAAELMRTYEGWPKQNQTRFGVMLNDIFAKYNRYFLDTHANKPNFYYANWDLCNIASLMSIGIFNDNATMYNYAVNYFLNGIGPGIVANGALPYYSIANFTEEGSKKTLMECQESGRDQGHALLTIALLGVIGQQGRNQGVDLYGAYGHQILNAAEYHGKYNTNHSVPYKPYTSWEGLLPVVSEKARFNIRPGFEAVFAHYNDERKMNASWTQAYRDFVNNNITDKVEGGGGDYGPNSGGFDSFGHGTLMYRISGN